MGELTEQEVFVGLVDYGMFAEVMPPCFSTKGLSSLIDPALQALMSSTDENALVKDIQSRSHDYIRYSSLRYTNVPRNFGVPHPESYVLQALAIKKHWTEIAAHCDKLSPRVSRIPVQRQRGGAIFNMNYKGPNRYVWEETALSQMAGMQYVVKTDISSCFPSVYTHSIPWALHTREAAKKKRKLLDLPGNLIDQCTQNLREPPQTNNLLIGPHSSNIISEIILTSVDAAIVAKGYAKLMRHIDDYTFYAADHAEAERFLHDLRLELRKYELTLNDTKTFINPLPTPTEDDWVLELNRFAFPQEGEITYSVVRSFLDLALSLAQSAGKSSPLKYAIKMVPPSLNERAKRLYIQEAINLALAYPYLARELEEQVFRKFEHDGMGAQIADFTNQLIRLGVGKLHYDAIAYGLHYAIKHKTTLTVSQQEILDILDLNDCLTTVLLLRYAKNRKLAKIETEIRKRSRALMTQERSDQDQQWLLIYQTWSETDLRKYRQEFLADLKQKRFRFLKTHQSTSPLISVDPMVVTSSIE